MKFRTTQKAIRECFRVIIAVPYCALQNLLNYENAIAYTARREGWSADIYDMGGGVAIATGYAPFGNVRPSHDILDRYERTAEKIRYDYSASWEEQRNNMHQLQQAFIMEVVEHG